MTNNIFVPKGMLAGEDAAAKLRRELREKILKGIPVNVTTEGNAMKQGVEAHNFIPKGKLAGQDAAAKRREQIRRNLINGKKVILGVGGKAMPEEGEAIIETAANKFAAPWYEVNPTLLTMEKIAMERNFPQFKLEKLEDDRLCWVGVLEPGIYESKFGEKRQYHVMAVYDNNHPNQRMGSSVRVYPLLPDVDELIESCGFIPSHLLPDEVGNKYLCTNNAEDQKVGVTTTTAASVLGWASKWLIAFELVLTGDLPLKVFNAHGGI